MSKDEKNSAKQNPVLNFEPLNDYAASNISEAVASPQSTEPIDLLEGIAPNINSPKNSGTEVHFKKIQNSNLIKPLRNHENNDIFIKTEQFQSAGFNNKIQTEAVNYKTTSPFYNLAIRLSILVILVLVARVGFNKFSDKASRYFSNLLEPAKARNIYVAEPASTKKDSTIAALYKPKLQEKKFNIAYANITVSDNSANVKVSINGVEILNLPPLIMYPIATEKEVLITAVNKTTNMYAERRVTTKPKETVNIHLILKKRAN